jgi:hypothetical protein
MAGNVSGMGGVPAGGLLKPRVRRGPGVVSAGYGPGLYSEVANGAVSSHTERLSK